MLLFNLCCLCLIGTTSARVARSPAASTVIPSEAYIQVETDPNGITWPWRVYKSSPYTPPNMTITGNGGPLAPGYVFMTPATTNISLPYTKEAGGFIMTSAGDLVFAQNVSGMTDFRKQYYNGKPYLTYWSGYNSQGVNIGHGYGQVNFLDDTYTPFVVNPDLHLNKETTTDNPIWSVDIHEQQMDSRDTILVSAYNNTPYDLSSIGGPADGWIVDCLVFELDVDTGKVLFSWSALDHVPVGASHQPLSDKSGNGTEIAPWDYFHINAIQGVGGNYLVNARHTWTAYMVSGEDGSIIWSLEGEDGGSFGPLPSDGTFRWQHFARAHNVTDTSLDISFFDNHNSAVDNGTTPSRGLVYHLELPASKSYIPELLRNIETPSEPIYADSQGSYHAELSNGNQLLGYGQIAITREYGPATDGSDLRWQAQFGGINEVQSYRAFKQTWHATPADWDPSLVIEDGKAYVSWNGATDVSVWAVYVGAESSDLKSVGIAEREGFETVFDVPSGAAYVQVAAVEGGKQVRRSNVAAVG